METLTETRKPEPRRYRTLGARIAALRRQRGLTQIELAHAVGISESYAPRIEKGTRRPDASILQKIADVLEAPYDELAALAEYIPTADSDSMDVFAEWQRWEADFEQMVSRGRNIVRRMWERHR